MAFFGILFVASAFAFGTSASTGECFSPGTSDGDRGLDEVAHLQTAEAKTKENPPKWRRIRPLIRRGHGGGRGHRYYSSEEEEEEEMIQVPLWPEEVEIRKSEQCSAGAVEEQEFSTVLDIVEQNFNDPPNQITTGFEFGGSNTCCPIQDFTILFSIGPIGTAALHPTKSIALAQKASGTKLGFGTRVFIRKLGGSETEMDVEEVASGPEILITATTNFFQGQDMSGTWQIAIVGQGGYEVTKVLEFQTELERCEPD